MHFGPQVISNLHTFNRVPHVKKRIAGETMILSLYRLIMIHYWNTRARS